jgi:hypothetical protein
MISAFSVKLNCRGRVPERVRDEVRVEVDVADRHLTVVECRPPWRADTGAEWTRFRQSV